MLTEETVTKTQEYAASIICTVRSRKFVELRGGILSVESAGLGKGISVRFTLPIIARQAI